MRDFDETVDTITISVDIPVNYYDKVAIRAGMVGMPVDIFLRVSESRWKKGLSSNVKSVMLSLGLCRLMVLMFFGCKDRIPSLLPMKNLS